MEGPCYGRASTSRARPACNMTTRDTAWRRRARDAAAFVRLAPHTVRVVLKEGALRRDRNFAYRRLQRSLRTDGPVVAGPWATEIGFELLYWVPMLRRLVARGDLDPERVVVVSRGGVEQWYAGLCAHYIDLFDFFTPQELRAWHDHRVNELGGQKHTSLTAFDREVADRAGARLGADYELLHPSAMYHAFRPFWLGRAPANEAAEKLCFAPIAAPERPLDLPPLPDRFVAVKAYFSSCFPATEDNRALVADLVRRMATARPVVLLTTGLDVDDHADVEIDADHDVIDASRWMAARDNLGVQTEVIRRADALVTTYGGFSYLGPLVGVPSLCFYSKPNFQPAHLVLMQQVARRLDGHFVALEARDLGLLDWLLPTATPA